MKTEEAIPDTSNQDSFGEKDLIVRSMFRRTPKHGKCTYTPASAPLSNTTAKRRGVPKVLSGQFRKNTELNDVDIILGDLNASA